MRNTEKKNMQRKLDELKRITGLSFSLDLPDTTNLPEAEAEETESYLLHQLDSLIASYKEVNSKGAIYKKWITGDLEPTELIHTAKRLQVSLSEPRAVFLVESKETMNNSVMAILKHAFPDTSHVWLVPMSSCQLAIVYTFTEEVSEETLDSTAYLVMDLLNTEALIQVNVAFSAVTGHLNQLPNAYQEASLALNVGRIFYPGQYVYP